MPTTNKNVHVFTFHQSPSPELYIFEVYIIIIINNLLLQMEFKILYAVSIVFILEGLRRTIFTIYYYSFQYRYFLWISKHK